MKTRKTLLLSLIVILLAIYIVQLTFGNKTNIIELTLEQEPDRIELESKESGKIELFKSSDGYVLGEKKYKTESSTVNSIVSKIKDIKILDTVSSSVNNSNENRYGLDEDNKITVKAFKDDKEIRNLVIGKTSATGSQTYALVDGEKSVKLLSGSLAAIFSSTAEQIRNKQIYSYSSNQLEQVTSTSQDETFHLAKILSADGKRNNIWTLLNTEGQTNTQTSLDNEKVSQWITAISSLRVSEWADDKKDSDFPESSNKITIKANGDSIEIEVAKISDDKYLCKASNEKELFYISSYSAENLMKKLSNLQ
ncbi:MAG: DUF4340 domain-containing protein [Treponema sp.]|nr:DUF4340 domain-containing protein [Treponema sp.]